ncbi:MAG: hypothetical protein DI536_32070 [Archangium gephyra]|uniref:ZU5 domain-containing protein n=1 Tax=Archangium gephyra TaxID=48 RepID=A0A2W5UQR3_9BACT|nr:MAG: hypothetical protein DI536_32070 [Archangium gephyra]
MKRALIAVLAVIALAGCPAPTANLKTTPAVTLKGEAIGTPKTQSIGSAGGTISSDDGTVSLTVPAGAVSADTMFTLTPIIPTGPGALVAYRIGPEGTTFSSPATIKFTAKESDLVGTDINGMRVAYQDSERRWRAFTNATVEGRSLSVKTTHLSDWSMLYGWQLRPPKANVELKKTVELSVRYCHSVPPPSDENEPVGLVTDCQDDEGLAPLLANWSVNGVTGGNGTTGTVEGGSPDAVYTAPATRPSPNTVSVSVEFNPPARGKVLLNSNITIGGRDLPRRYVGNITLRISGLTWGGDSIVTYEAGGQITYEQGAQAGKYKSTGGTYTSVKVDMESPQCTCTGTGTGPVKMGLDMEVPPTGDLLYEFETAADAFDITLSCTPKNPQNNCSSATFPSYAQNNLVPSTNDPEYFAGLPGATMTVNSGSTDPYSLSGNSSLTLVQPDNTMVNSVTWSFTGED